MRISGADTVLSLHSGAGRWPRGQREAEGAAPARLALDPDAAAVQLDQALGQRQPEAGPFLLARVVARSLPELLEDDRLVFLWDADPRVRDGDHDALSVRLCIHGDRAVLLGELHRVGEQVDEDLLHRTLVGGHRTDRGGQLLVQPHPAAAGSLLPEGECVVDRRRQIERREAQVEPPRLDLRQRSEEHTSELQSLAYLVCRLLLEKKKNIRISILLYIHATN